MKMKKIVRLILIVLTLTGCTHQAKQRDAIDETKSYLEEEGKTQDKAFERDFIKIDEIQLRSFFEAYFSLSGEERLLLNQNVRGVEEQKQAVYDETLGQFQKKLEPYLSALGSEKLLKGFLGESFHFPKLLEMNQYVTTGKTRVEEVSVKSVRPLGENSIYQVEVITKEEVMTTLEANQLYVWDEQLEYYREKGEQEPAEATFGLVSNLEEELKHSYLFLQETPLDSRDEIQLKHQYWVEVKNSEKLEIEGVEEANLIGVTGVYRKKASNNQYVERMSYRSDQGTFYEERIKNVFRALFTQPKDFFLEYEYVLKEGQQRVRETLEGIGLGDQVIVPKEGYKNAYSAHINPYKENLQKIEVKEAAIELTNSLFGTLKQPRYTVKIPVRGLTKNNEEKFYCYEYLVGFEQEKVEFIHFIAAKEIALEQ